MDLKVNTNRPPGVLTIDDCPTTACNPESATSTHRLPIGQKKQRLNDFISGPKARSFINQDVWSGPSSSITHF
jgi:hypothetical protein